MKRVSNAFLAIKLTKLREKKFRNACEYTRSYDNPPLSGSKMAVNRSPFYGTLVMDSVSLYNSSYFLPLQH